LKYFIFDGLPSTDAVSVELRILPTSKIPTLLAFGYFTNV
jgi:hypothetical protein